MGEWDKLGAGIRKLRNNADLVNAVFIDAEGNKN